MRNPDKKRIWTVTATVLATALLAVPATAGATATEALEALDAGCGGIEAGSAGGVGGEGCGSTEGEAEAMGCVLIDPWTVPPHWEIHWDHCLGEIYEDLP